MPLTAEQRQFFVTHGWLKIENAMSPEIMDRFLDDVWVRLGFDPNDKSTWVDENGEAVEFLKMPRHREVLASELCPKAWEAMVEIAGGDDKIDPVRERYHGDQFIINFGSEESSKVSGLLGAYRRSKAYQIILRSFLILTHKMPWDG